jgi:hypothetical protein
MSLNVLNIMAIDGLWILETFTKLTKQEIEWLSKPSSWMPLKPIVEASSPYEALIKMSFSPATDSFTCMMFIAASLFYKSSNTSNSAIDNIIYIVDNKSELDDAFKNTRIMKMLIAVCQYKKYKGLSLVTSAKKLIAHVLKKFPDFYKLGYMRTKSGKLKITPEEAEKWL